MSPSVAIFAKNAAGFGKSADIAGMEKDDITSKSLVTTQEIKHANRVIPANTLFKPTVVWMLDSPIGNITLHGKEYAKKLISEGKLAIADEETPGNRIIIQATKDSILEIRVEGIGFYAGPADSILKILGKHLSEQPNVITYTDPE